jgi:signal peptidase II
MLLGMVAAAVRWQMRGAALLGLTLFVAGGASNWLDRLIRGFVIDFLNIGVGPVRTGIFNVADVAIMTGAALMLLAEIQSARKTP